ncbi:MAG: hypothetical protein C5B50_03825 [Verrucomicrobia bacterium]|nr:MAG: hypothetical protein C5B50_03825 [Verrucomicrobiota bacterium]
MLDSLLRHSSRISMTSFTSGMFTAQADPSAAFQAGYRVGQFLFFALLAGACWWVYTIARRPRTNKKCALALLLELGACFAASIVAVIAKAVPGLAVLNLLVGLLLVAASLASVVLAIIGLIEYADRKGVFKQGRAQAIIALSLAFLTFLIFAAGVVAGFAPRNGPYRLAGQPYPDELLRFDDLNFKFRAPPRPWVQADAKRLNRESSLAFLRSMPEAFFMVIAEKLGADTELNTSALAEIAKERMRSTASRYRLVSEGPATHNGFQGWQLESRASVKGYDLFYLQWIFVTNGYSYQFTSWGRASDADRLRSDINSLYSRFDLIDPGRQAPSLYASNRDFESTNFHFRVRLAGSGWRPSSILQHRFPAAEFAGVHGAVGLAVVPLCLRGMDPPIEAMTKGLFGAVGIEYPNESLSAPRTIRHGPLSGQEFDFQRSEAKGDFAYRIRLLKGLDSAFLVAAWLAPGANTNRGQLSEALDRVEFDSVSMPAETASLPPDQQAGQAQMMNEIGLFYYKRRQFEQGLAYFRAALGLQHNSSAYLQNLLTAYAALERPREALDFLRTNSGEFAGDQKIQASEAGLEAQLGMVEQAISNYAALFAGGFRSDEHFSKYIQLVASTKDLTNALSQTEAYLAQKDSDAIRLVQANLYKQNKDYKKAVSILKTLHEKKPYDSETAYALADAYSQAGLFQEALDICRQLVRDSDSADAYYYKARNEYQLKRFREAKDSLEIAQKKLPANREIKRFLDLVSGMLGEGDNISIKDPIPPVIVPEELLSCAPGDLPAEYVEGYGAQYINALTAISYEKNKEFKTTDYRTIHVLDSGGVSKFSTLQWDFEPLAEDIFVNKLEIKNDKGEIVHTGNPSDYYVIDASTATYATQRKILNMPVPTLRPGCTIEFAITRREAERPPQFRLTTHNFSMLFPAMKSALFVRGDLASVKSRAAFVSEPHRTNDSLYWVVEHPAVFKWEPYQPLACDYLPTVWLGDKSASWDNEARKYLDSITDRMELDTALKEEARKLVSALTNQTAQAVCLARFVQTNYTYKAIEFGRRARIPQRTRDISRNKFGDCKDHALLLQQYLDAVGIPARLALVNSGGKIQKDLPSLDAFNHMVVFAPSLGNGRFFDCTEKGSDIAQLVPLGLAGTEAMVLEPRNSRLVSIPEYPAGSSSVHSLRQVVVTNQTEASVRETLELQGYPAAAFRTQLKSANDTLRREIIYRAMNSRTAQITGLKVQNLEDTASPLVLQISYLLRRQFQDLGDKLSGPLPSVWEHHYLAVEPADKRLAPLRLYYPLLFRSTVEMSAPAGYEAAVMPAVRPALDPEFASCEISALKQGQGEKVDYQVALLQGTFPASRYSAFQQTMDKALAPLEQNISFEKSRP